MKRADNQWPLRNRNTFASEKGQRTALQRLRVERITSVSAFEALASEWYRLDATLYPRTPFSSPLWNLLWWKYFREQQPWVRDELYAHTLRNDHGQLIAVAPLMLTTQPDFGPLRVRTVQFFGADRNLTEIRGLVCRAEHMSEAVGALRGYLLACPTEWDRLQWSGLQEQCPVRQFLDRTGKFTWSQPISDYWLPLQGTWDDFKASQTRNIKESLRKCYNSLRRDGHQYELRIVQRPEDVSEALSVFFHLHTSRAIARDTVPHPDVFAATRSRAFFSEYAQLMAERGLLRIFQLRIGGKVVATRVGFALDGHLYLYYSGYDMRWRKYSVMTTVLAEAIKWAIEQRFVAVNLSTGCDTSKTRWRPQTSTFFTCSERSPTLRGHLLSRAYESLGRIAREGSRLRSFASIRRTG